MDSLANPRLMRPLSAAFLLFWLALACNPAPAQAPTPAPTATLAPTASPTASPTPAASSVPEGAVSAQVVRVVDGDTIEVEIDGRRYTVRYIGVDTPETKHPTKGVEPYGVEAYGFNRTLVEGETVYLEKDVSETDRYGRLLRYVYANGEMVNAKLVREGYARVATFPPDVKHAGLFLALEREAREADRGLWGVAEEPTPTPESGPPSGTPGAVCDYSDTSQPVIKGNISRSGERIYHVPGGAFYQSTTIDTGAGEMWFCTEAEAVAAGWRKSSR